MSKGGNPYRARVWRESGSGGKYTEMNPEVRPDSKNSATFSESESLQAKGVQPEYPEGGSVRDVLAWVGDDLVRARMAFVEEEARDAPRTGVTAPLRRMLAT